VGHADHDQQHRGHAAVKLHQHHGRRRRRTAGCHHRRRPRRLQHELSLQPRQRTNGAVPADNAIASSDYVVYQAADGHWVQDTVSSVSGLSVTLTGNVPTGGVLPGGLFYFFGISTDIDPATNLAHVLFDVLPLGTTVTSTVRTEITDPNGLWCSLHPGDPILIYTANVTTAAIHQLTSGYYARR
jgi:hypothetical protein